MSPLDLINIGKLCVEAGHLPHRILIFMDENQFKSDFAWLLGNTHSVAAVKVTKGPLFAGVQTIALIRYAGYCFYIIDPKNMRETLDAIKRRHKTHD